MLELHPQLIEKNGRAEFVVLSSEEYQSLLEYVEDMEDLLELRQSKAEAGTEETISLEELQEQLRHQ